MDTESADRRRRLRWQCRRAILELDLLLTHFLETRFAGLTASEQAEFEHLLQESDFELWSWIQGQTNPPPEHRKIIRCIS